MNISVWIVIIILIIILLITFFVILNRSLKYFKEVIKEDLNKNLNKIELQTFSAPVHFNPFPENIVVENPDPCTERERKKCKLEDPTSCFGCQNLIARCVHFSEDIKWFPADGSDPLIIPANETSDEGYCLQTVSLVDSCNSFHGDFVLVQTSPDSRESQLICLCRNPGIIGNTNVLGNCSTVFGCNGKIEDLNVPFEEIKCICESGYFSETRNDIPICSQHTVESYPDLDKLSFQKTTVPIDVFANTIRGNYRGNRLINPCLYDLLDGSDANGMLVTIGEVSYCVSLDEYHVAIRRNPTGSRILRGDSGPDAIIKMKYNYINYYGEMEIQKIPSLALIFDTTSNPRFAERFGLKSNTTYAISLTEHQDEILSYFGPNSTINQVPLGLCEGHWPSYTCWYHNYGQSAGSLISINPQAPLLYRYYAGRKAPPLFISNLGDWNRIETEMNPVLIFYPRSWSGSSTVTYMLHFNPNFFSNTPQAERLRALFLRFEPQPRSGYESVWRAELWRTENFEDWNRARLAYIPFPNV